MSVLLPVFNARPTLPAAWASLQTQTFTDWECVAVDDGSTDGSAEWLEDTARGDRRLRVVRRAHGGIVAALNEAFRLARAPLLARMDADDLCHPERLGRQVAALERDPGLGVVSCLVEFLPDHAAGGGAAGKSQGYALHVEWLNGIRSTEELACARFVESPVAHPTVIFRRACVEQHGGYREGPFPEDYELWLRWMEAGVRFGKVGVPLLAWRDSPGRLSRCDPRYDPEAFYRIKAQYLARWLRREVGSRAVWIWGAGRRTRRRVDLLVGEGVAIEAFVDIDPAKLGRHRDGRCVHPPDRITAGGPFVIGYVANRGARDVQRVFLTGRGLVEGRDFLFAA